MPLLVIFRDYVHRVGQAENHQQRRHQCRDHAERVAERGYQAEADDDAGADGQQGHDNPEKRAERDGQDDGQDECDERRCPDEVVNQDVDDGDLEMRGAAQPDGVIAFLLIENGLDVRMQAAAYVLPVGDVVEMHNQRGGISGLRYQAACIDGIVQHPLPDGVYAGRIIADVLDERRDIQAIVDAADIECVGE